MCVINRIYLPTFIQEKYTTSRFFPLEARKKSSYLSTKRSESYLPHETNPHWKKSLCPLCLLGEKTKRERKRCWCYVFGSDAVKNTAKKLSLLSQQKHKNKHKKLAEPHCRNGQLYFPSTVWHAHINMDAWWEKKYEIIWSGNQHRKATWDRTIKNIGYGRD